MQDLRVIGVENGALLVAADDGTKYRIAIDEVLHSKLRQAVPEPVHGRKLAPREIQAQIRAGMSAEDVSAVTGVALEFIQKFEGAVLAEREYVIETALAVPVHTALETDPLALGSTFGSVIRQRLYDLGATNERWASWKEAGTGWVVKLSFTANDIDHDARWGFDPKKRALDPQNGEAITLSQQGESTGVLIPRLRAVHPDERHPDATRFDSGAFDLIEASSPDADTQHDPETRNSTQPLPELASEMNQTADLLDALRRRRGEREAANFDDESAGNPSMHPSTGGIRLVDIPLDLLGDDLDEARARPPQAPVPSPSNFAHSAGGQPKVGRKGRQTMPSWDEIVFGARPDDDLA
ncbi:MAG: hypothetical protein JWR36_1576 [Glaciihabitans sp.]|nr:hypothetical protein [Glaciihabitans sp.]